jgi:pimeloyl-ACP methyl ester carboxylesterase
MSDDAAPEFRWLERGDGEPVILLHGLMGRADDWEQTLEELGDVCRPIALALPIFDPRLAEASIDGLARHVVGFLDALGIGRAVLGGNSLGGHVALAVALACPERVSGLVLTGSSGLFERTFTRGVSHRPTAEYIRRKMEEVVYDPALVTPSWVAAIGRMLAARRSAMRVVRFARAARQQCLESRLGELSVPALLVWGRDDRITPLAVAGRFHDLIAGSRLCVLSHCGHVPMIERPQAFNDAVAHWLGTTRPRREVPVPAAGGVR